MRVSAVFALALLACTLVVSCAPPQPDMTVLRKTVDAFNAATKDVMMNGNPDKVMGFYEDNAMEMAPNMPTMTGKAAIRQFQEQMMQAGMKMTAVEFKTVDLEAGGKVAYEIGTYDMTISMPKMGDVQDRGKYVAIWRQQSDGSWKVHAETWNTDMPLPSMEPMGEKKEEMKGKK
jgi:ketosteroid isomerase-like protein